MTKPSWQDFATHDESAYPEVWDGVVGAWCPSLGPTGLRLHDHSRRSNWGTLTNMDAATDWTVSGGQYTLDFDGSDDYAITTGNIVITGAEPRTVSTWLNLRSTANATLWVWGTENTSSWFNLSIITGVWYISGFSNDFDTGVSAQTGLRHVVVVYDGATVTLYIDGINVASAAKTYATVAAPLWIGRRSLAATPLYINATLFDLAIWGRAMARGEIWQLYNLGRGGMYQRRRRTLRRVAAEQGAAFKAYWARRNSQLIGGGV